MATSTAAVKHTNLESIMIQDLDRFTELLGVATGAVDKNPALPILSGVLVEAEGNNLVITGSDSVTTIRVKEEGIVNIMGDLRFVIPGKFFFDAIKKLPRGEVEILIEENVCATLRVMSGKKQIVTMQFNLMDVEEYPNYNRKSLSNQFNINPQQLTAAFRATVYAAHKKDDNHVMSGIHLEGKNGSILLTATDRHRLSHYILQVSDPIESFSNLVIPASAAKEMIKMLEHLEDDITVEFSDTEVQVVTEKLVFQTRVLDGKYPNIQQILAQSFSAECKVKRADLQAALDRASICASEYKTITFQLKDESIVLRAKSDGPSYEEELQVEEATGEMFFGADVYYLLDALKNFQSDIVQCKFTNSLSPVWFKPVQEEGPEQMALVIPVRMSNSN